MLKIPDLYSMLVHIQTDGICGSTAHDDPFLPVTYGSYGVPQLRFAQSLYDCGVGAKVSHLTPPTHALAEGSSDTCSPKDNRPDLNLQRVLTI